MIGQALVCFYVVSLNLKPLDSMHSHNRHRGQQNLLRLRKADVLRRPGGHPDQQNKWFDEMLTSTSSFVCAKYMTNIMWRDTPHNLCYIFSFVLVLYFRQFNKKIEKWNYHSSYVHSQQHHSMCLRCEWIDTR